MPEPPGPPGFITTEPIRSCCLLDRIRMTAMSKVSPSKALPFFAVLQFCGTVMVPHCTVRSRGRFGLSFCASAPHDCQEIESAADALPEDDGWTQPALGEQPAAVITKARSAATSVTGRRMVISAGSCSLRVRLRSTDGLP